MITKAQAIREVGRDGGPVDNKAIQSRVRDRFGLKVKANEIHRQLGKKKERSIRVKSFVDLKNAAENFVDLAPQ